MTILAGYWGSWMDVAGSWPYYQDMCVDYICPQVAAFLEKTKPYTTVFFAFQLLSQNWYSGYDPYGGCSTYNVCGGAACPFCSETENKWPGTSGEKKFRVIPECRTDTAYGITMIRDTTPSKPTNALNVYREIGRMLHQHPDGSKQFFVSFGGWSDCITFPSADTDLEDLAEMMANFVIFSFADGIDLDFEHFSIKHGGDDLQTNRASQIDSFGRLILLLRKKFSAVTSERWLSILKETNTWLDSGVIDKTSDFYKSNKVYLRDLCGQPVPSFGIVYTPRFNAFVTDSKDLGFSSGFATDGEGLQLFKKAGVSDAITGINFMTYDQAFPSTGAQDQKPADYIGYFSKMIESCQGAGIPLDKIRIGIEPGPQAGDGTALDMNTFIDKIADLVKQTNIGGVFFWSINLGASAASSRDLETVASIINPVNPGKASYTKAGANGMIVNPEIPVCPTKMIREGYSDPPAGFSKRAIVYLVLTGVFLLLFVLFLLIGVRTQPPIYLTISGICLVMGLIFLLLAATTTNNSENYDDADCIGKDECSKRCGKTTGCDWICLSK